MSSMYHKQSFLRHYVLGELQFGGWGLVERGVSAITALIVLSALSLYEYGVFQLLLAVFGFAIELPGIAMAFIENDLARFLGTGDERQAKRLFFEFYGLWTIATLVVAGVFFFGSDLFIPKYGIEFARFGKLLGMLAAADALRRLVTSILKIRLRFGVIASRKTMQRLVQLLVLGVFFVGGLKIDIRAVLLSMVISLFGASLIMVPAAVRAYAPWRGLAISERSTLPRAFKTYGKWGAMQAMFGHATEKVEPWLVKILVNTEAVAVFVVARSLIAVVTNFIPTQTLGMLIPMRVSDRTWSRRVFLRGVKYQVALTFLGMVAGVMLLPLVVRVFFSKYVVALPYFYALAGTAPIAAIGSLPTFFLRAMRRQKFLFLSRVLKSTIALPLTFLLLPIFGLWGLVIERWVRLLVRATVLLFYLRRFAPELALSFRDLVHFGAEDIEFARGAVRIGISAARPYYRAARRLLGLRAQSARAVV